MYAPDYNINTFLKHMEGKSLVELYTAIQQECYLTECTLAPGKKGVVKNREHGGYRYLDLLKKFAFYFQSGIKPFGLDDFTYAAFQTMLNKAKAITQERNQKGE